MLSICIPSYNQLDGLRETLFRLHRFESLISESLEVIVSDNASRDQRGLDVLRSEFPWVCWYSNDWNLGFMGNLTRLVALAK